MPRQAQELMVLEMYDGDRYGVEILRVPLGYSLKISSRLMIYSSWVVRSNINQKATATMVTEEVKILNSKSHGGAYGKQATGTTHF